MKRVIPDTNDVSVLKSIVNYRSAITFEVLRFRIHQSFVLLLQRDKFFEMLCSVFLCVCFVLFEFVSGLIL